MSAASDRHQSRTARLHGRPLVFLLAVCGMLGGVATNLFLPALPDIRSHFAVGQAAVQTTISAYVIAFAAGILIVGPLSDRFGRRPVILAGLGVFSTGSLLAALAPSLPWLVAARVVQAIGASAGITVARASVGDVFEGAHVARGIALMTMAMVIGNAVSPYVGGVIAEALGWHADFWFLLIIGLATLLACWWMLPETRSSHHRASGLRALGRSARELLGRPLFLSFVLQSALILSVFLVFMSVAPYVMADTYGRPPSEFGLYSLLLSTGYFLGNVQVSRYAHSATAERLLFVGLWMQFAGSLAAVLLVLVGPDHPLCLFGPMLPVAFGQGMALPYMTGRAVTLAPGYAGTASSLVGFAQQSLGAICVQAMGWAPTDTALPVWLFCATAAAIALAPLFVLERRAWSASS